MEQFEKSIKEQNLRQQLRVETEFDTPIETSIEKSRSGVYKDNPENRKHARVGQPYGQRIHGGATQNLESNKKVFTTKDVTSAVKNCSTVKEWGIFFTFNDKLKDGKRKLKFMRNGWPVPQEMKDKIIKEVKNSLKNATNIESIGFKEGYWGGRGSYDYLRIVIKESDIQKSFSEDTILKAFEEGLISKDVFEKGFGKRAELGEIRTWHGVQMKKVSSTGNPKQDWQPIKQGTKEEGEKEPEPGEGKMNEEDLREHARQSSEAALQAAIKNSDDPTIRMIAHQELERRNKEEKPQEEKDEFPSKEFNDSKKKESDDKEKKNQEWESKWKDLQSRHQKERSDHESNYQKYQKDRDKEIKDLQNRHKQEKEKLYNSDNVSPEDLKKLHSKHEKEWNEHASKHLKKETEFSDNHNKMTKRQMDENEKHIESKGWGTKSEVPWKEQREKSKLTPKAKTFLDELKILDNKIEMNDIEVEDSPKGNWIIYVKGKEMGVVGKNLLDEETIDRYGLRRNTEKSIQGIQYF